MSDDILLDQIGLNAETETQRKIIVHIYSHSPGFTISQLFFLALGFQPIGHILLGFQDITKEARSMNTYKREDIEDVPNIDLNKVYDGQSQTVNRIRYFVNILNKCGKDLNETLDGLYDRNPNLVNSLQNIMEKYLAYGRNMNFVKVISENNKCLIIDELKVQKSTSPPYLFYSKLGISKQSEFFNNLPIKVFIKQDVFYGKLDKLNKELEKKNKIYYQMTFIIGSKDGIPILMLFNDNCAICSIDNSTKIVSSYEDISNSIDYIYMVYYSINENLNTSQELYQNFQFKTENLHTKINGDTDEILRGYIEYKYRSSWVNPEKPRDFNFIELIQESIQYPSFFGICSGFSINESCYYGTVMLSYDKKSAENIQKNISDENEYANSHNFYTHYQTFTSFVLYLFEFLKELGFLKNQSADYKIDDKGFQKIDSLCKSMFETIPPINDMLFDLFIDFIHKIIMSDILPIDIKNKFIKYLYHTVANFKELGFENKNMSTETIVSLFKTEENVSPSTVGEIVLCYANVLKIPEDLISKRIGIENYKQEYFKITEYSTHLSATYLSAKIHL